MSSASMLYRWVGQQVLLTLLAITFALPLLVTARLSLQGRGFENYLTVFQHPLIPQMFLNSLIVTLCTIVIVYVVTSLAAYAFSKLEMKAKSLLFLVILVGLMIPPVALIVPLFTTVAALQLFDNYLALIIPYTAFILPLTLLLMRNFFDGLPDELLEAARVDGCNSFTCWLYIVVPLSKPIAMVVVIWTFLFSWNEYFLPLLFMQDPAMRMVTQAPQFFYSEFGQDVGLVFATLVLVAIPIMICYLSLQRHFEQGMTAGRGK